MEVGTGLFALFVVVASYCRAAKMSRLTHHWVPQIGYMASGLAGVASIAVAMWWPQWSPIALLVSIVLTTVLFDSLLDWGLGPPATTRRR